MAHSAAGKLLGLATDGPWYEAAFVAGMTNALNVVADGLSPSGQPLLAPAQETEELTALYDEIRDYFQVKDLPAPFGVLGRDPGYLRDFWSAYQRAFEEGGLSQRFKEALAFAVSLTTRSAFGTELHLTRMRQLGVGDKGVLEVVGVTQMFSSYTKIADVLQLEPDMGHIAPQDHSPPPGGKKD